MSISRKNNYLKRALSILVVFCFLFLCSCKDEPKESYYYEYESEVVYTSTNEDGSNVDSQANSDSNSKQENTSSNNNSKQENTSSNNNSKQENTSSNNNSNSQVSNNNNNQDNSSSNSNNKQENASSNNNSNSQVSNNNNNQDSSSSNSNQNNNSSNSSGGKEPNSLDALLKSIPANLKNSTVTVYSWNEAGAVSGAPKVIENFTKKTGIKVKWNVGSYDNYATEISALVAAGKSPDIIRLMGLQHSIISNMDPLSKTGFDFTDGIWDKNVIDFYTVNGKKYGANLKNTLIQQPTVLLYNKDTIAKYDFEDPYTLWKQGKWTWEKFKEMLVDYNKETKNPSWSPRTYVDIATTKGEGFITKNGDRFKSNMSSKTLYNGLVEMSQMYQDGLVDSIPINYGGIANDKNLFLSESIIGARRTHFYFVSLKEQQKLKIVPLPSVGSKYVQHYSELEAYGLAKGAKNASGAYYFLRYYLDADNYDQKTFFPDTTFMDVYKWCLKQDKIYVPDDHFVITADTGETYRNMWLKIIETKPDQISSFLAKYSGAVANAVKSTNNRLDRIK